MVQADTDRLLGHPENGNHRTVPILRILTNAVSAQERFTNLQTFYSLHSVSTSVVLISETFSRLAKTKKSTCSIWKLFFVAWMCCLIDLNSLRLANIIDYEEISDVEENTMIYKLSPTTQLL